MSPAAKNVDPPLSVWYSFTPNKAAKIWYDAGRGEVQPRGIGHPARRDDGKRSLGALAFAVLAEVHPHASRRLLKRTR